MLRDLTGQRFWRWLVLERGENDAHRNVRWVCRCDCGRTKLVWSISLLRGQSRSCGCLRDELASAAHTTHGHARVVGKTAEYEAWRGMLARCYNPNRKRYKDYGGRDIPITVCDHWRRSYPAFLFWVGPRPSPAHSLDRIDNDGNYEPGNVRWATAKEQANNRRPTRAVNITQPVEAG